LIVRTLDRLDALPVPGVTNARAPFPSPDGRWVGFFTGVSGELRKVSLTGEPPISVCRIVGVARGASWSQPLLQTPFAERNPQISPDGHWLAYESNESGQEEIYVRRFPKVGDGLWQISVGGGNVPLWARSGRELFYRNGDSVMSVAVQTTPTFSAGTPTKLFQGYVSGPGRAYDVSRDGQRFLMIKDPSSRDQTSAASMVIVLNWHEELKARVPVR
jgi:Tol biopolymer transport system component